MMCPIENLTYLRLMMINVVLCSNSRNFVHKGETLSLKENRSNNLILDF